MKNGQNNNLYNLNQNKFQKNENIEKYEYSTYFPRKFRITAKNRYYKSTSPSHHYYQTQVSLSKNHPDVNELKTELLESKTKFHLRSDEIKNLRVVYKKLDMENKTNLKMIEQILGAKPKRNSIKYEGPDQPEKIQISQENKAVIEQTFKIKKLKRDLSGYQKEYSNKINEINYLKEKAKVVKMVKLGNCLFNKEDEFKKVKVAICELESDIDNNEKQIKYYQTRVEFFKSISTQASEQLEIKRKLYDKSEAKKEELQNRTTKLENKIKFKENQNKKFINQLKEMDFDIKRLKETNEYLENLSYQKETLEERDQENAKNIKKLKGENDELAKELGIVEKTHCDYLDKVFKYERERPRLLEKAKEPSAMYKEKEKKIIELQEEIKKTTEAYSQEIQITEQKTDLLKKELEEHKKANEEYKKKMADVTDEFERMNLKVFNVKQQKIKLETLA